MSFKIVETFYTIQGEGHYAGTAAYFIRFFSCNLRCDFGNGFVCDDGAHTNKALVNTYTVDDLVAMVKASKTRHVVLTGGEVSLVDVNNLIRSLQYYLGVTVQVETNGHNMANIADADFITYSPKGAFDKAAAYVTQGVGELKLIAGVHNPVDMDLWASYPVQKYVQPIGNEHSWDIDNVRYCIEFVKANPDWKLSLQTHKAMEIR